MAIVLDPKISARGGDVMAIVLLFFIMLGISIMIIKLTEGGA